jgi:uncharacterized protein YecT (DUF1311 family)
MKSVLMLALALLPALAHADATSELAQIDKSMQACIAKDESNMGMKMCTGEAYEAADKLLNRIYKNTTLELKKKTGDKYADDQNAETLKRLVAAQRAWIPFKDAQCELEGTSMLGGSGESLVIGGCMYQMTVDRVKAIAEVGANQ